MTQKQAHAIVTPGLIVAVLVAVLLGFWLRGSFCAGSGGSVDGDRSSGTGSTCARDGDCPAGQRCFRYEAGNPDRPHTTGYCTSPSR